MQAKKTMNAKKPAAKKNSTISPPKKRLTVESVADALRELKGNQSAVGRKFEVSRSAVSHFIADHPELKEVAAEAKESFVDNVESAIYVSAIGDPKRGIAPNVTAQIFILKTLGKGRGYVERNEYTGKDGKDLFDENIESQILAVMKLAACSREQAIAGIKAYEGEKEKVGSRFIH